MRTPRDRSVTEFLLKDIVCIQLFTGTTYNSLMSTHWLNNFIIVGFERSRTHFPNSYQVDKIWISYHACVGMTRHISLYSINAPTFDVVASGMNHMPYELGLARYRHGNGPIRALPAHEHSFSEPSMFILKPFGRDPPAFYLCLLVLEKCFAQKYRFISTGRDAWVGNSRSPILFSVNLI